MATENKPGAARPTNLNLSQRMIVARQHMQYIKKTKHAGLPFATVNHDEVTMAARDALDKANVLAIPSTVDHGKNGNCTWAKCSVTFVNADNPKECYEVVMFGEGNDSQDKGPGKAISYAIKYCYLKALMAETGEADADMQDVETEPEPAKGLPVASHEDMVERMLIFWGENDISIGEVQDYLEVEAIADITEAHLEEMIKLARAVRSGKTSAKEALKPRESTEGPE